MLKLTMHLYAWTGHPRYGDFYERAYYNHIIGSIGEHGGIKTYAQALGHGSRKKNQGPTSCCYGTGMESFSKLADSIYYFKEDSLFVNLYIASVLEWKDKGVKVTQETIFPESDGMIFTVETKDVKQFALNLRVPFWATKGMAVTVNGKKVDTASAKPTSWFTLNRRWNNGDKVEVCIPMSLHYQPMPDDPDLVAIMCGPLVLAGELDERDFADKANGGTGAFVLKGTLMDELVPAKYYFTGDRAKLEQWIKPVPGKALTFKTVGQPHDVVLRPYNVFRPHARTDYGDLVDAQGLDLTFKVDGKAKGGVNASKLPDKYNSNARFEVYWVLAKDGNSAKIRNIRDEQAKFLENKERMIDVVMPKDPTENVAYRNRQSEGCSFGDHMAFAEKEGARFSWDMKVTPDKPTSVLVYFTSRLFHPSESLMRGNDFWNSSCDILVNDRAIGMVKPQSKDVPWINRVEYIIPEELTKDRIL